MSQPAASVAGIAGTAWIGQGVRRVEARLVEEVRAWQAGVRAEPARLARPLVVVVPSRSLKDHVSALLVRELGALAGVGVHTHHALALQILERAGLRAPGGAELVPVLVRQHASRQRALRDALDTLDDGYGAVSAAVSDLLDAGLDAGTAPAVREVLAGGAGGARARAAAVVEVALALAEELERRGLGTRSAPLVRAREALETAPTLFAPGRLLLHGYADATGVTTDFLRTLLRGRDALVLLDRPPDPADPSRADLGAAFAERFEQRIAPVTPERDEGPPPPAERAFFRAPGTDAEVRAVARAIRARLGAGALPESIGVVTRTPALYAAALRTHFERLGIPFSGVGVAGPRTSLGRRVSFVLDLLRQRGRMPADRFVEESHAIRAGARADLRLGLHALGVARLADLAALEVAAALGGKESFPLPVRRGLRSGAEAEGSEGAADEEERTEPVGPYAARRHLGRALLARGVEAARAVAAWVAGAERAPLGPCLRELRALLTEALGWGRDADTAHLVALLDGLAAELPADLEVDLDELALALARPLGRLSQAGLGGEGGGVQVLDVVAARARSFGDLFVLGLNRDHFPRVIAEDPLLPDAVRRELESVLPELPVKERGHDEERFLFAQLVSASPRVTLSWQLLGDDGKAKAPSPLVERLLAPREAPELVPTLLVPGDPREDLRPAHEWVLLAGLHGGRAAAAKLLPVALAEARGHAARPEDLAALAAVRARAVEELDAYGREDPLLGPYFGHVGAPREAADLRHGELWVTHAEAIARCPWQGFLTKLLKLERPPDALEALPEATPLLVGGVVHAVLERIVRERVPEAPSGAPLGGLPAVEVPWPAADRLEAILREEAERALFAAGIGVRGFAHLLAEHVRPQLDVARELDWALGAVPVVGAELTADVELPGSGAPRRLWFRADRVDRMPDGRLRLTDYKTGKPVSDAARESTRGEHFAAALARGRFLQAAAYARAAPDAEGRFLFLKPTIADEARRFEVRSGDEGLEQAFAGALARVVAASDLGTFVPRLLDADGEEPDTCGWCELAMACLRGDSGARRRLADWAALPSDDDDARARALRGVFELGAPE